MIRHLLALSLLALDTILHAAPPPGYTAKVTVAAPTRIDWTFTVSNRSVVKLPPGFIDDNFDSTKQSYELFVPPRKDVKQPLPCILFISAGDEPQGWKSFEGPCKQLGLVFIGVRGAGNSVRFPKRSRIILDCFDDVRKQIPLDPDRTYISGFSGGGRMACGIAFALPEYFGGVMPIVASGELRDEPWLRHRAIDRLSIALITGQTDFNRGEIEKWKGPQWKEIGLNTRAWTFNMGHAMPSSAGIVEVIKWLDEKKDKRAALAKKHSATRAAPSAVLSREEAAKALFEEGKQKLVSKTTLFAGLMLLKGTMDRWPDVAAGRDARKMLEEYEAKKEKPWEDDDIAEQIKYTIAEARSLSDYVLLGIPPNSQYAKQRPGMAKSAIELWGKVFVVAPNSAAAKDGKKRIAELEKIVEKK